MGGYFKDIGVLIPNSWNPSIWCTTAGGTCGGSEDFLITCGSLYGGSIAFHLLLCIKKKKCHVFYNKKPVHLNIKAPNSRPILLSPLPSAQGWLGGLRVRADIMAETLCSLGAFQGGGGGSLDWTISPPKVEMTAEALFNKVVYLPDIKTSVCC